MAKFNPYILSEKERKRLLDEFFIAISNLKNFEDVRNFFKDLLSESEQVMLARRLQIAKMLLKGVGYQKIRSTLRVGFDNINAVNCWLRYGRDGYIKAIKILEVLEKKEEKKKDVKKRKQAQFNWYDVKKRYPAQFWPKDLLKQLDLTVDQFLQKSAKKSQKKSTKVEPS